MHIFYLPTALANELLKPGVWSCIKIYGVYQNDWSGLEVGYIHKYDEETYKY